MRAVVCRGFGGPEVLELAEVPDPEPQPGEVLVRVTATALNRADLMQRQGRYPPPPGASELLGLECAGVVEAVGAADTDWRPGDRVCALLSGGGYAELVAVPAGQLLPIPAGLSDTEAAALPEVVCTVWSNLFMVAGLRPGELLLVHGGGSGIGTMAIQLAKTAGARVACTVGSERKATFCRELGADLTILYTQQNFVSEMRRFAGEDKAGADVILDNMGAAYLARNIQALAIEGRLVVIGLQGGARAELDLAALLRKRAAVIATTLRARSGHDKAAIVASVREHVWPLVADGVVRPIIDSVLPLPDARAAHERLAAGDVNGKVVLSVAADAGA